MIWKIAKIKNLGLVFGNYTPSPTLPDFKQVNIVYGWNGAGKTTLSRLFSEVATPLASGVEYEIHDEAGRAFRVGEAFPRKIRVFNQDYVRKNLQIIEGKTNSISIVLGSESQDLLKEVEAEKTLHADKARDLKGQIAQKARKTTERDGKFTEVAKTIGAAIGGSALRDYRKPQAEKEFKLLSKKQELPEPELQGAALAAKQEALPQIDPIDLGLVEVAPDKSVALLDAISPLYAEAKVLMAKTVESQVIDRLVQHKDLAEWVEEGIRLHENYSSQMCEYCNSSISTDRVKALGRHFNEADRILKNDVDELIARLKRVSIVVDGIALPDRARFYAEMRPEVDTVTAEIQTYKTATVREIATCIQELQSKKGKTTEPIASNIVFSTTNLKEELARINEIIERHRKKTTGFQEVTTTAIKSLKAHYLSTIYDAVKALESECTTLDGSISTLQGDLENLDASIKKKMAKVSNDHKACEIITENLATFLGHRELSFVPDTPTGTEAKPAALGYRIMRGSQAAVHLSEGEKTAIAFVYFVVHLGDREFDVKDGIVVVDDPISSLDSNSLYQAFSFLKNSLKDAKQAFVLTHNFDFLKLLINWRKNGPSDKLTGYYMIKNDHSGSVRQASIVEMDRELYQYESEYHYLFKLLKQMKKEQDGSIAKAYPIPNIARKVWDTFLTFSVPDGKSLYRKMDTLKSEGVDAQKLDAIYKFTNDQSHITGAGFNPSLVPESRKVVGEMFEMMEKIAPRHFRKLDEATN